MSFALPPMQSAHDAAQAAGAVLTAVAEGELTPTEGAHVMGLVETCRRTLETTELEACLAALEAAHRLTLRRRLARLESREPDRRRARIAAMTDAELDARLAELRLEPDPEARLAELRAQLEGMG